MSDYERWMNGDLTDEHFLGITLGTLGEIHSELAPLQDKQTALKNQLGHVMAVMKAKMSDREYRFIDDLVRTQGVKVSFYRPSTRTSVNHERLTSILQDIEHTHPELFKRIRECYRETNVDGGQRIEFTREE